MNSPLLLFYIKGTFPLIYLIKKITPIERDGKLGIF